MKSANVLKPKQLSLLKLPPIRKEHGGSLNKGRRKLARPIDPKRPIHLVLRASRARGNWSMLTHENKGRVDHLIKTVALRFGVKVYRFANVGNHLHLVIKAPDHEGFKSFLRLLSGKIALAITKAKKGAPQGKFWDSLAYTRLIEWGREFEAVKTYVVKNLFEAAGLFKKGMKVFDLERDYHPKEKPDRRAWPVPGWAH